MVHEFALDLRLARRRSGLSQADCAHLLGVDASRVSKLESGKSMPSIIEHYILCAVFDHTTGSAYESAIASLRGALEERLASMPACPRSWRDKKQRSTTLRGLGERLDAVDNNHHA